MMISAKSDQTNQLENGSGFSPNLSQGDSQDSLKITLKMIAALVILISAHLVLPRLADLMGNLHVRQEYTRKMLEVSHEELVNEIDHNSLPNKYEPPNFGAPESNRGSGTR